MSKIQILCCFEEKLNVEHPSQKKKPEGICIEDRSRQK